MLHPAPVLVPMDPMGALVHYHRGNSCNKDHNKDHSIYLNLSSIHLIVIYFVLTCPLQGPAFNFSTLMYFMSNLFLSR